jgi:hypothetical protein
MTKLYTNVDPPNTYYGENADGWVWSWNTNLIKPGDNISLSPILLKNSSRMWMENTSGVYRISAYATELSSEELKEFAWIKLKAHSLN